MVYVAVFVPSPESLYLVTQQARRFQSSQIHVDVLHRFGTQPLDDLDKYDMIVARGITYRQICARYPQKHIIHLDFDGADIVEALLRCREQFSPRHIALCLERRGLEDLLPDLEALCEAEIRLYDVVDGESAVEAVDAALADGMDALVCAGTVGHICTDRGHPCVYIRTRREVLEGALEKAVDAARNIHIKYAISNVTRMILDDIEDAVLAVDESGRLLAANRRARQLYQPPPGQGARPVGFGDPPEADLYRQPREPLTGRRRAPAHSPRAALPGALQANYRQQRNHRHADCHRFRLQAPPRQAPTAGQPRPPGSHLQIYL